MTIMKASKSKVLACLVSVLALFLGLLLPTILSTKPALGAGGYAWIQINGGPSGATYQDLAWDGSGLYVAAPPQDVWHYDPGTGTWKDTGGGTGSYHLLWADSYLYSGSNSGVQCYEPKTGLWTDTGGGVSGKVVRSLAWDGSNIYAGTYNYGIWRYDPKTGVWTDTGGGFGGFWVNALAWDGTGLYAGVTYIQGYDPPAYVTWMCHYDPGSGTWSYMGGLWSFGGIGRLVWDGSNLYVAYSIISSHPTTSRTFVGTYSPGTGAWNPNILGANFPYVWTIIWNGASLYAGTGHGVWRYDPATGSWSDTDGALSSYVVGSLAWDGTNLYATARDDTTSISYGLWRYGYQGAPTLSSLSPANGPVGAEVTINGAGFGNTQGSSYVSFGATQAIDYTSWSDTQIRCKVPAMAAGDVQVTVTTPDGASDGLPFTVRLPDVKVTSINPTSGMDTDTMLTATINGSDFQTGATVRLENTSATKVINATNVNAISPSQIISTFDLTGAPLGSYDVVVKNPSDPEARLTGGFTITNICGQGAGVAVIAFGLMIGLLSLAGSGRLKRRKKRS